MSLIEKNKGPGYKTSKYGICKQGKNWGYAMESRLKQGFQNLKMLPTPPRQIKLSG